MSPQVNNIFTQANKLVSFFIHVYILIRERLNVFPSSFKWLHELSIIVNFSSNKIKDSINNNDILKNYFNQKRQNSEIE